MSYKVIDFITDICIKIISSINKVRDNSLSIKLFRLSQRYSSRPISVKEYYKLADEKWARIWKDQQNQYLKSIL
jgi:hypothetical protein